MNYCSFIFHMDDMNSLFLRLVNVIVINYNFIVIKSNK